MSEPTAFVAAGKPVLQCDVVMKGGITSGVVYPGALVTLGRTYRFRGLGGASAGAIGAALGAAAEHGRATQSFDRLGALPSELGAAAEHGRATQSFDRLGALPSELSDGRLKGLFQARRDTRPMLRLMLAGSSAKGDRKLAIARATLRSFPVACLIGVAPGVAAVMFGAQQSAAVCWVMAVLGVLAALAGLVTAALVRIYLVLTRKVTANNFGICTGLRVGAASQPGFTEWLSDNIDDLAGRTGTGPLTFGQLWTGTDVSANVAPADRDIDLRLVTTCLSESQPFELPLAQGRYYFDAAEWKQLFPEGVVQHMVDHERATGDAEENRRLHEHQPPLTRLPMPEDLPVVVATRMSLSFPLLISAIPMWTIDRRSDEFVKVWFTDGGLCNNFPVQLFDAALPAWPTFAINLGRFDRDSDEQADETGNVRWAKDNNSGIAPRVARLPHTGLLAIVGFASQSFNSARNWSDVAQLDQPGYRDRIVEVLQTKAQGGMNLDMSGSVIERLADRGEAAAAAMVDQFTTPKYKGRFTGWDNHRWMRYRATLAALPDWLESFKRGMDVLDTEVDDPPSVKMDKGEVAVASAITDGLVTLAATLDAVDRADVAGLMSKPRPPTVLRRVPQL